LANAIDLRDKSSELYCYRKNKKQSISAGSEDKCIKIMEKYHKLRVFI